MELIINWFSGFANELFGNSVLPAALRWIILAFIFLFVELIHRSWMIIWFTLGSLAAMVVALLLPNDNLIQIGIFFGVTAVSLGSYLYLKPPATKPSDTQIRSGRKVMCVKTIENGFQSVGSVRIDGVDYRARLTNGSDPVKKGEWVVLVGWDDRDNLTVAVRALIDRDALEEAVK